MKILLLTLFWVIGLLTINAQENNYKIHSVAIGLGGFSVNKYNSIGGGVSLALDLTSSIGKNLLSPSFLTGTQLFDFDFYEFRIQYGRELGLTKWLKLEFFGGIGYYIQKSDSRLTISGNSGSFPFKFNTKFYFNDKCGLGINSNYSVNKVNNNFSINLIFHYKFK